MANRIREIRTEVEAREEVEEREEKCSFEIPLENIRSNVRLEEGFFEDENRWEIDLEPDILQSLGVDTEDTVTVQVYKISGVPIVNVSVLE